MASKFKREFKNVVRNYTDAETKVREATSNDPWGPSSALMSELAEYTNHVQAYGLVMGMLWKRLNDHGKNWRHVYKSLIVLEYLIKAGSERVAQQCKDNMFSIQTLKDFQYVDKDGKDQGTNIREKAKNLVALLKDDTRLKEERKRAKQARERQEALSSDSPKPSQKRVQFNTTDGGSTSPSAPEETSPGRRFEQNVEQARPADETEEEMQLRLALQISKQQADEEEKLKNQEEESLKAAIALSKQDTVQEDEEPPKPQDSQNDLLLDFSTTGIADPWSSAPVEEPPPSYDELTSDPWGSSSSAPPSVGNQVKIGDPWATSGGGGQIPPTTSLPPANIIDPWNTQPSSSLNVGVTQLNGNSNPFDLSTLGMNLPPPTSSSTTTNSSSKPNRIEDQFLGDHAPLVDLDSLLSNPIPKPILGPTPINPFGVTGMGGTAQQQNAANPFTANKPPAPSLNQLATTNQQPGYGDLLPPPIVPMTSSTGSSGNSPILAHRQPSPYAQPTSTNQSFNPFS